MKCMVEGCNKEIKVNDFAISEFEIRTFMHWSNQYTDCPRFRCCKECYFEMINILRAFVDGRLEYKVMER